MRRFPQQPGLRRGRLRRRLDALSFRQRLARRGQMFLRLQQPAQR
ncbi:MAG: hypothetical protein AAB225_11960 [Acidobacteriota bacterium]